MPQERNRIPNTTRALMLAVAGAVDAVQLATKPLALIPFVGIVIAFAIDAAVSILAGLTFGLWFALRRVNFFSGRRGARKALFVFSGFFLEVLPVINILPAWFLSVWYVIKEVQKEDRAYNKRQRDAYRQALARAGAARVRRRYFTRGSTPAQPPSNDSARDATIAA